MKALDNSTFKSSLGLKLRENISNFSSIERTHSSFGRNWPSHLLQLKSKFCQHEQAANQSATLTTLVGGYNGGKMKVKIELNICIRDQNKEEELYHETRLD